MSAHPILLTLLVTLVVCTPILWIGAWLYLRRRSLSPRLRVVLMLVLFLFILISGPIIFWMWTRGNVTKGLIQTGRGGTQLLGKVFLVWLVGVISTGAQLFRLWRKKGDL